MEKLLPGYIKKLKNYMEVSTAFQECIVNKTS